MINTTRTMAPALVLLGLLGFCAPALATPPEPDGKSADQLIEALGCRACHRIKNYGGSTAPDLTAIGNRLTTAEIAAVLTKHIPPGSGSDLPAYSSLTPAELELISVHLYNLH